MANPTALLMSAIMMLRHMGERSAGDRIEAALNQVLQARQTITRDLGGKATTSEFADAVITSL
jgi:isocitrate dehydrogenase (NAD+)